ncbi:aminodeoxychorismate/anthranilate synthase component II [Neolewinella lacunae]|uniref:Aminodeoxychorismate/anthranilate synthase component II n=1 Tax=Neolewinella lacunae TaxID=1517758 RepID=A0A923PRG7_9BACT|nr:aminodeoxychorismate/anthranilate synthase component II [Neolewinella lacunae]MBC6995392.1 aminodeoxychorismate/anthranilate synthase component II [Neolewinella lacunae]MDN3633104.1 aminodeoxychorismate/anthranilate synthase component II [Neolewinella lacunae]
MKVLVLDNYDSFTYNLVQYIEEELECEIDVFRNDEISLDRVGEYDLIVLSPGPGVPREAGIMPDLIRQYAGQKAILGVCLGHQAIGEAFGGTLHNLDQVLHGIETEMLRTKTDDVLFAGVPEKFNAGRYHSWVLDPATLPAELEVTATDESGGIMAVQHRAYPIFGVQFHPESIMTAHGRRMIRNVLQYVRQRVAEPAVV